MTPQFVGVIVDADVKEPEIDLSIFDPVEYQCYLNDYDQLILEYDESTEEEEEKK